MEFPESLSNLLIARLTTATTDGMLAAEVVAATNSEPNTADLNEKLLACTSSTVVRVVPV